MQKTRKNLITDYTTFLKNILDDVGQGHIMHNATAIIIFQSLLKAGCGDGNVQLIISIFLRVYQVMTVHKVCAAEIKDSSPVSLNERKNGNWKNVLFNTLTHLHLI